MSYRKKEMYKTGGMYIGVILTVVLLAGCTNAITPQRANADELTAGAAVTLTQKESDVTKNLKKFMKKDGYTNYLKWQLAVIEQKVKFVNTTANYKKEWKKYLTKKQKERLEKNLTKVINANRLSTIDKLEKDSDAIVNKASLLKDTREKAKKTLARYLKNGREILNVDEKKAIKEFKSKVHSTYSIDRLNSYVEETKTIYADAKERKRQEEEAARIAAEAAAYRANLEANIPFDCSYWSLEKLEYVNYWGERNNSFLAGTPMEGLGYYIVHKAYDYNCDPALLVSIANQESGCGVYPYGCEYNAYGWICMNPPMYSWEDGIDKWYDFFGPIFEGDIPVQSMHGYGGYGVDSNLFAYAHSWIWG